MSRKENDTFETFELDCAFDLEASLKLSIETSESIDSTTLDLDLLTLSPLTSLEATPDASPTSKTISLELDPADEGVSAVCVAEELTNVTQTRFLANEPTIPSSGSSSLATPKPPAHQAPYKQQPSHTRRAAKRARMQAKASDAAYIHYKVRPKVKTRYVDRSDKIKCDANGLGTNHTSNAFTGRDDGHRSRTLYNLSHLVGENSKYKFRLFRWNGSKPYGLIDRKHKRLVGILAGVPSDNPGSPPNSHWPNLVKRVAALMETMRSKCRIVIKRKRGVKLKPRRGHFVALQTGVSHRGGQRAPNNVQNLPENAAVVNTLNANLDIQRVAGFQSSVMATWAPNLFNYYSETLGSLFAHDTSLRRNFHNSIFPITTYNMGPRTECFKHTDFANLPFGLCAITPFGSYDPSRGGHLVLWEYELVIEFPPGSTILIPSGVVAHSNVPVGPGETRYSMVQYSAGALFRWVEHGFQATETYVENLTDTQREAHEEKAAERWKCGLSLLPFFGMEDDKKDDEEDK